MNKKYSWYIVIVFLWIFLGIMLFPRWWYEFFYMGQIFNLEFWMFGIQDIFRYFFYYNPTILLVVLGVYILYKKNLLDIKIIELDFFSSKKKMIIPVILSVILAIVIFFYPYRNKFDYNSNYDYNLNYKDRVEQTEINTPLDFIYINKGRITNLFEQIKPELILKEKQLESQSEDGKELSNGENPIINSKISEKNLNKSTNIYEATEISDPKKVTSLLNHFYSLNAIREFQTMELSAEDVKKLETFRTISQQFQITYDKSKFAQVYNRVIGETLIKEHSNMKSLSGQLVIKGDYIVSVSNSKTTLKHNYILIDETNRITFNVTSINGTEKITPTLSDIEQNNKTMNLSVFGKVSRVESNNQVTDIYFDAYAIW